MINEYKISDLIKILEDVKESEGDLPVKLNNSSYGVLMNLVSLGTGYEDSDGNLTDSGSEDNTEVFFISY